MSGHIIKSISPRPAPILRYETEGSIRMAVVRCPYCDGEHRHVYPDDVMTHAPALRGPKCRGRRPDYSLIPPERTAPDDTARA